MRRPFIIFGSESSIDIDIAVFVDAIALTITENVERVKAFEEQLRNSTFRNSERELNVNLAVLEGNIITKTFKGTPDELNNAILDTYNLHTQYHPLLITKRVERDVDMKTVRALRTVLSFFSRIPEYRTQVKKALKSKDNHLRFAALQNIFDAVAYFDLGSKATPMDDFVKVCTFQFAQVLGLIDGIELYTKEAIMKKYPYMELPIMRKIDAPNAMCNFRRAFLEFLIVVKPKLDSLPTELIPFKKLKS